MQIAFISDTHGRHSSLKLPASDMIIHAGDFCRRGKQREVEEFLNWYSQLPHKHKILIAGNHDFLAEQQPDTFKSMIPSNIHYLENNEVIVEGIKIWGSPITPWFHDWAFNRQRGEDIKRYWDLIPEGTDILITHGPPLGYGDQTARGERVGCKDLLDAVSKIKPAIHVYGHIHEAYGEFKNEHTLFLNVSCTDLRCEVVHHAVVVAVEKSESGMLSVQRL